MGFCGDRFVNDTKTNQQQIPIVQGLVLHLLPVDQVKVNFIRKKNFSCFYQHTSCYILVPLLLVSSPFLLISGFFITRLFLVPLLLVFFTFPPHKVVFHYEVRRLETPSWSCPREGRARTLCSSSWVSVFPPFRVSCVSLCLCARPTWTWGTPPQWELLGPIGQAARKPRSACSRKVGGKITTLTECFPEICHWEPFFLHSNASCIWKISPPIKCLLNRCCIEWVSG